MLFRSHLFAASDTNSFPQVQLGSVIICPVPTKFEGTHQECKLCNCHVQFQTDYRFQPFDLLPLLLAMDIDMQVAVFADADAPASDGEPTFVPRDVWCALCQLSQPGHGRRWFKAGDKWALLCKQCTMFAWRDHTKLEEERNWGDHCKTFPTYVRRLLETEQTLYS